MTGRLRILSLGAGVQSSTMAFMYKHGVLGPMPDAAVFADTKNEPDAVYDWLNWLQPQLPFPVYRVTRGDLMESAVRVRTTRDGERTYIETAIPVYTLDGLKRGMGQRHCTRDFKIAMVRKKARDLLGLRAVMSKVPIVDMIMGISTDEFDRRKMSPLPWIEHEYPLLDEVPTSRGGCEEWMLSAGYPLPPRSACKELPAQIGCGVDGAEAA